MNNDLAENSTSLEDNEHSTHSSMCMNECTEFATTMHLEKEHNNISFGLLTSLNGKREVS